MVHTIWSQPIQHHNQQWLNDHVHPYDATYYLVTSELHGTKDVTYEKSLNYHLRQAGRSMIRRDIQTSVPLISDWIDVYNQAFDHTSPHKEELKPQTIRLIAIRLGLTDPVPFFPQNFGQQQANLS